MSLTKPIGQVVNAFDATTNHTFYFTSSGGNQVVYNRIIIRNNTTNVIVYNNLDLIVYFPTWLEMKKFIGCLDYLKSLIHFLASSIASSKFSLAATNFKPLPSLQPVLSII